MKSFSLFLSLYILVLCCTPCDDIYPEDVHHHFTQSSVGFSETHTDHCSPFCTCQCCQNTFFGTIMPGIKAVPVIVFTYREVAPEYKSLHLQDFLIPPKA